MEEKNLFTPYDEMTQTKELQMLKTIVPFLAGPRKRQMAILVQYMEMQNTLRVFSGAGTSLSACEIPEGSDRRTAMLGALRTYCSPKEQEMIDTFLNMLCIMESFELL